MSVLNSNSNLKAQIVTKFKTHIVTKLKECQLWQTPKLKLCKPQKIKLWQNSKTQIVREVIGTVVTVVSVTYFSKNNLTPQQTMRCSRCSFSRFFGTAVSVLEFCLVNFANIAHSTERDKEALFRKCAQKSTKWLGKG